jgi:hypothetical protein
MSDKYEIQLDTALKDAWGIFCQAPEVFVSITLGLLAVYTMLSYVPLVGPLIGLAASALGPSLFFVAAESGLRKGKISFESLQGVPSLAPQLLALFVVKAILIGMGFFCLVLPGIFLTVIFSFAELYVVLENKSFLDALKASKAMAERNFFGVLGLLAFLGLLGFAGLLVIGLGILVSAPVSALTLYCVFRRVSLRVI